MRPFDYTRSRSVDETLTLIDPLTRPLAGGTDLLTLMKEDLAAPERLVDIKRAGLSKGIEETGDGLLLGALTTLTEIEMSPLLKARYALLSEAASLAATPQLRNRATLGGNLLQRPRCWYFRNEHVSCWLKGGDTCPAKEGRNEHHALFGEGPCVAVHPSDLASCLLTLDAEVRLRGAGGEHTLSLTDFYKLPEAGRRQETVTKDDELVLSRHVPALHEGARSTYLKAMDRKVWAFALVGVAAVLHVEEGVVKEARVVLSGVVPVPWRSEAAEGELVGEEANEATFARAAAAAVAGATPLGHNAYKMPLAGNLIRRALQTLARG